MELETLETERLYLKKVTPSELKIIFSEFPVEEAMALMGLLTHEDYLRDKAKSDGGYVTYDRTIVAFLLVSKETGKTLGRGGFHNWYFAHRRAELGYALMDPKDYGKGYMGEAVKAIIRYGFEVMNLNRIEASTSPNNVASKAILARNGFQQEGYMRQHYCRDGMAEDSVLFGLLKEEYRSQKT
jgi:ribosomal-protein-alanine N-acetyltransferase